MNKIIILMLLSFNSFAADLTIKVNNILKQDNFIRVAIYNNASDFPGNYVNAIETVNVPVTGTTQTITIKNLKPDTYAISLFHDTNDNEILDTNSIGIPREPFGFSNNPRLFGPPKFHKCKFKFTESMTKTIYLKRF
jgi:uncharacterized protein (DUF2141 family)